MVRSFINPELIDPVVWVSRERPGERFRVFWSTRSRDHVTGQILNGPNAGKWTDLNPHKLRREGTELTLIRTVEI